MRRLRPIRYAVCVDWSHETREGSASDRSHSCSPRAAISDRSSISTSVRPAHSAARATPTRSVCRRTPVGAASATRVPARPFQSRMDPRRTTARIAPRSLAPAASRPMSSTQATCRRRTTATRFAVKPATPRVRSLAFTPFRSPTAKLACGRTTLAWGSAKTNCARDPRTPVQTRTHTAMRRPTTRPPTPATIDGASARHRACLGWTPCETEHVAFSMESRTDLSENIGLCVARFSVLVFPHQDKEKERPVRVGCTHVLGFGAPRVPRSWSRLRNPTGKGTINGLFLVRG